MKCPNCGGKNYVCDTVHNYKTNEIYRRRKCTECKKVFYTVEFEIELTKDVRESLSEYRKKYSK